ncbi:MAG: hypothetical protein D4S01_08735 [Dehalococcoidia bacterium]|nr:MAG: hypothetical protein D4S01_08735 [Dehalococcoidia bacterium]
MGLKSKNTGDFGLKAKKPSAVSQNIIRIGGGSTVVGGRWIHLDNKRIDIKKMVDEYVSSASRRLFNNFNDVAYVLIVATSTGKLEVIPSLAFNKKSFGDVKVFPELVGKIPLVLIKLQHDGSAGLTGMKNILPEDIELYKGYGNHTLHGPQGETGVQGITGSMCVTGYVGGAGYIGVTGPQGETGAPGVSIDGATGLQGEEGVSIPAFIYDPPTP